MQDEPGGAGRPEQGVHADARAVARAVDVLTRHTVELMALDWVVSVGVGLDDSGVAAIVVGASHTEAAASAALPSVLEDVPVVVRVVGPLEARPSD